MPVRLSGRRRTGLAVGAAAAAALATAALVNHRVARRAERRHPAAGRIIGVDGVALHCVERGIGDALVLLHGNGSMIEDFAASGLLDRAARHYRVLAFDRPGYGHSTLHRIADSGHMIHHTATDAVMAAIDEAAYKVSAWLI